MDKQETSLRNIFKNLRDGLLVANIRNNKFVLANEAICKMLGYTQNEILNLGIEDIHPEKNLKEILDNVRRQINDEISIVMNVPVKRKDGSIFYADINTAPVNIEGKECLVGIFRDITERKKIEEHLNRINTILKTIRNINQLITFEKDPNKLIQKACDIFVSNKGYSSAVIGLVDNNFSHITDYSGTGEYYEKLNILLEKKEIPECVKLAVKQKYVILQNDKSDICRSCYTRTIIKDIYTFVKLLTYENNIYGFLMLLSQHETFNDREELELIEEITNDISFALHSIKTEIELKRKEEQLKQTQKLEAIGQLAGGIAHDFNNVLTVILGYTGNILNSLKEKDNFYLEIKEIRDAAEHASKLTKQLLAFSRKQILKPEIIDLNTLIKNYENILKRLVGEDIDLKFFPGKNLSNIYAEPFQIEQILLNLSSNARDAMPEGGILTIETSNVFLDEDYVKNHPESSCGPHVMLALSDSGCGIDKEIIDKIFDPFFTTKREGTGMGLSTVYGIVKQTGGNILVYSEKGKGTTFKIYFPVTTLKPEEQLQKKEKRILKPKTEKLVVVIEDEPSIRTLLEKMLRKSGYKYKVSSNIDVLLEILKKEKLVPDLLLVDVVMPKTSGKAVAEKIKKVYPEIKVLYMSGYTDNVIVHHGILDKSVSFLQKPFTYEELISKITETLSG